MANKLYEEQMNQGMMSQFNTFMRNPLQFLMQRRINVPPQYANDPQGAVQYLLSSGQMSQETYQALRSKAEQMGVKMQFCSVSTAMESGREE